MAVSGPDSGGGQPPESPRRAAIPGRFSYAPLRGYCPADLLAMLYLVVVIVLLLVEHDRCPRFPLYLGIHLGLLVLISCLPLLPRPRWSYLQLFREAHALWLMPLAYGELDVLNRLATHRYFDDLVLRWDHAVFGLHPHLVLHQWFPNPVLSEFLHFCYLFYVLLVPVLGLTLFFQRRHEVLRVFVTTVMLNMYACYLIFIFFPVRGPWYTFARPPLEAGFFSGLVRTYLDHGASVGAAFPSSHVAGAVVVALMGYRFSRRVSNFLIVLALGIFVATVYGGFHYGIDALVGLIFGVITAFIGPRLHSALLRRPELSWRNLAVHRRITAMRESFEARRRAMAAGEALRSGSRAAAEGMSRVVQRRAGGSDAGEANP